MISSTKASFVDRFCTKLGMGGDQIRFWLICWQNTHWLKMFLENLRWEFPFQICPHSCRKPPFKACSPTLGWIYGGSFYLKVSDFSTKPFSQIPQSPFADLLLPLGNNSSRGKYLIWGLLSFFYPFVFLQILLLAPHSRADLYSSYLNPGKFGCLEFLGGIANRTFHGKSGFSTHAEDFEAPAKYLGNFTRRLWTCKIGPFCCREIQKVMIRRGWLVEKVGTKNLI